MAEQVSERRGREGGRWINERPASEEFAEWFTTSMKIDPALKHEDYIGGVVLIPAVDTKAKHVTGFKNGQPVIEQREELSFIPYAKVETRINYFWDLLAAHEEWVGVVEHVEAPRMPIDFVNVEERETSGENHLRTERKIRQPGALTAMVHQLPPGFSVMSVPVSDGYSHFLCCTLRVSIYGREDYATHKTAAVPLRTGRGTKQVPLLGGYQTRVWADSASLMKAETGALGRALGFAGIFIIPGSGVATAEDMIESMSQGTTPATEPEAAQGPEKPADDRPARTGAEQAEDDETQLRKKASELWNALSKDHSEKATEFGNWARSRHLSSLSDAKGAMLRGVVKKLEKLTEEARGETREEADVPAEETAETTAGAGEEATGDGDEPSGEADPGDR